MTNWEKYKAQIKAYFAPSIVLFLIILFIIRPNLRDLIVSIPILWAFFYWATCLLQFPVLWDWVKTKMIGDGETADMTPREKVYHQELKARQAYEESLKAYRIAFQTREDWDAHVEKLLQEYKQ